MKVVSSLNLMPIQLFTQGQIGPFMFSSFQNIFPQLQTPSHVPTCEVSHSLQSGDAQMCLGRCVSMMSHRRALPSGVRRSPSWRVNLWTVSPILLAVCVSWESGKQYISRMSNLLRELENRGAVCRVRMSVEWFASSSNWCSILVTRLANSMSKNCTIEVSSLDCSPPSGFCSTTELNFSIECSRHLPSRLAKSASSRPAAEQSASEFAPLSGWPRERSPPSCPTRCRRPEVHAWSLLTHLLTS